MMATQTASSKIASRTTADRNSLPGNRILNPGTGTQKPGQVSALHTDRPIVALRLLSFPSDANGLVLCVVCYTVTTLSGEEIATSRPQMLFRVKLNLVITT